MSKIAIVCEVRSGKLIVPNKAAMQAQIAQLPDGPVTLEIKTGTRSQAANRLYWKWLNIISEHTGYMPEELHEDFKARFNARTISTVDEHGEVHDTDEWAASTAGLETPEFSVYLSKIQQFAAEWFGITLESLPDTDKVNS